MLSLWPSLSFSSLSLRKGAAKGSKCHGSGSEREREKEEEERETEREREKLFTLLSW